MDALAVAGKIMITKIRLMALLALATGSYQVSAALSDGQAVAAADNAFAFKLLKQLAKEEPGMNIFTFRPTVPRRFCRWWPAARPGKRRRRCSRFWKRPACQPVS